MSQTAVSVNRERLIQTFLRLVRCNTPPKFEREASVIARDILLNLGFECAYDNAGEKVGGNIGNLIAFKKGSVPNAPGIFFSAHFDTVEPTDDLEPVMDGDFIRSDGKTVLGADDKCGVASILEAMHAIVEQDIPHGDIQLLLTICEEIGLVGAFHIDPDTIKTRYGYVLDTGPPVGSFIYSAPTQDILDVVIHGHASHAGAAPELGVSAILVAARAVSKMKLGRIDPETTANVGLIKGGTATNIIAEECFLKCELRSRDSAKLENQYQHMRKVFADECAEAGARVTFTSTRLYRAYELAMNSPVLEIGIEGCERIGIESHLAVTGGGSDANIFNERGFSTTVMGCGMVNIHRHDEYVSISDMMKSAQLVVSIVETAAARQETDDCSL